MEYGYSYRVLDHLRLDFAGGLGYLHNFYPENRYEISSEDGRISVMRQWGKPRAIAGLGVGLSIPTAYRAVPFLRHEMAVESPFANGIPDYYTLGYQLDWMNKEYNNWNEEEVLEYVKGKKANHEIGASYWYSNTHFLLLGMIIEKASGKSLKDLYEQYVFTPLQLESAYFSSERPLPEGAVKGHVDIYGDGTYVESEFLYKDELGLADGGIACNAYETGLFFEKLMRGELLSQPSMDQMTDWFPIPTDWVDYFDHTGNGYGIMEFETPHGKAVGHTGAIYGFFSLAQHFPAQGFTLVVMVNSATFKMDAVVNLYQDCLELMFET